MSSGREPLQRIERLAKMQSLKALASAADYSAALADSQQARAALQECDDGVQAQAMRVEAAMAGGAFDFERWRIGRAVLDSLTVAHSAAAESAEMAGARESSSRHDWHCEQQRERRVEKRRKARTRRQTDKRDEAAASEAAALGSSHARRSA